MATCGGICKENQQSRSRTARWDILPYLAQLYFPALHALWEACSILKHRIFFLFSVSKDSQYDVPETDGMAGKGRGSKAEASSNNGVEDQSKKLHLKAFFKEEGKQKEGKIKGAGLTITAEGKADGVQLEELQNKASLERNVSI